MEELRARAEAERDAISLVASAEEQKSEAVRQFELMRASTEQMARVLSALPLKQAKWINVGHDTPISSLTGLLAAARELVMEPKTES